MSYMCLLCIIKFGSQHQFVLLVMTSSSVQFFIKISMKLCSIHGQVKYVLYVLHNCPSADCSFNIRGRVRKFV